MRGAEHVGRWQKIRDQIHAEVCERGYNKKKKAFTQFYGSDALDASLLTMPLVGFLPVSDERVSGTIEAIERELMQDGLVLRYRPQEKRRRWIARHRRGISSLFVLAGPLSASDRSEKEAKELFERLLDVRNDLGLLSEEYDPTCASVSWAIFLRLSRTSRWSSCARRSWRKDEKKRSRDCDVYRL